MFRIVSLSIFRSFLLHRQQWYMSYRFTDSLRKGSRWNSILILILILILHYRNFRQEWTQQHPSFNSKIRNAEKVKQVVVVVLVAVKQLVFLCWSQYFVFLYLVLLPALAILILVCYKKHTSTISTCRVTKVYRTAQFATGRMHLTHRLSCSEPIYRKAVELRFTHHARNVGYISLVFI